jgi:hypothetical protein
VAIVQTDDKDLLRDTHSKGLLSNNRDKLLKTRAARKRAREESNKIMSLKHELEAMQERVKELESFKEEIAKLKELICDGKLASTL